MILTLQGCMAVGKTTTLRWAETHAARFCVCHEDDSKTLGIVHSRGLRQHVFEDYIEIQRLYIKAAIRRARTFEGRDVLMDFGPDETLFFTLNYPASIGHPDWPVASALESELAELSCVLPRRTLFLDAEPDVLCARKAADLTRTRGSFDHHLSHLMPLKRAWLLAQPDVDVLDTNRLTRDETGQYVLDWAETWFATDGPADSGASGDDLYCRP